MIDGIIYGVIFNVILFRLLKSVIRDWLVLNGIVWIKELERMMLLGCIDVLKWCNVLVS